MSLFSSLPVFGKGVNKWLDLFSSLKTLHKYFLVDWRVLLPSSCSYPWSWCRCRRLQGHFHSHCPGYESWIRHNQPCFEDTLISNKSVVVFWLYSFCLDFLFPRVSISSHVILHCEENGMFKIFFRKVITISKTKTEIKSKPTPSINCLGHQENSLPRSRNKFSCLAVKSDVKPDFCRLRMLHGYKQR